MEIEFLADPRLSWSAKGLYSWLLLQEGYPTVEFARLYCPDEEELISALEELKEAGLLGTTSHALSPLGDGKIHEA